MLNCSLDYLISAIKMLSTTVYQPRSALKYRIAAFNQGSPLLENGLVDVKRTGTDRAVLHYRLDKPYTSLVVKDLMTPDYPQSTFQRQLMTLCAEKRLCEIDQLSPSLFVPKGSYSGTQLLSLLCCLDVYEYTPVWEDFVRATSNPYRILRDMQDEGIVLRSPRKGYGYRLIMSLTRLRIHALLPYLYAKGPGSEYQNRLLYVARFQPLITLTDNVITKSQ